jgi:hypothetical protein
LHAAAYSKCETYHKSGWMRYSLCYQNVAINTPWCCFMHQSLCNPNPHTLKTCPPQQLSCSYLLTDALYGYTTLEPKKQRTQNHSHRTLLPSPRITARSMPPLSIPMQPLTPLRSHSPQAPAHHRLKPHITSPGMAFLLKDTCNPLTLFTVTLVPAGVWNLAGVQNQYSVSKT